MPAPRPPPPTAPSGRPPASDPPLPELPELPVRAILPALQAALSAGGNTVLVAPPGSGKTSLVPLAALRTSALRDQRILMLEPRRVAARAAAWRMADLLGESVGQTVGYRMRMERRESARTRITVLTEGLLARRLLQDPELSGVGLVIFDEFHERGIHADLALALCRDVQGGLRPDLRLLLMSATLDDESLGAALGGATLLRAEGRQFPVETRFAPRPAHEPLPRQVASVTLRALAEQQGGILVFLPGEGEIRSTERWLRESAALPPAVDLHPLYGALSKAEQDAALRPAPVGRRKLVLATAIAESSLTIEGVHTVVDSGWMRSSRFSPATGMERLETLRVTRDRADQRRGRAGRLAPGVCYRLWDEITDRQLAPASPPEILTADLAPVVLAIADWGTSESAALPWLTPPPAAAWTQAVELLQSLRALDAAGRITPHGRRMVQLPMHPRLAHMVLMAGEARATDTACLLAALLAERVTAPIIGGQRLTNLAEMLDAALGLTTIPGGRLGGLDRARALARDWQRATRRLSAPQRVAMPTTPDAGNTGNAPEETWQSPDSAINPSLATEAGVLLALAYPDRIAQRRGPRGERRYLLSGGRGVTLRQGDPLSGYKWLVVAELDDADADATVHLAAPLPDDCVETLLRDQVTVAARLEWDARNRKVRTAEVEQLGAIVIRERPLRNPDTGVVLHCLCEGVRSIGIELLDWTPRATQLRGRLALMRRLFPEADWPDVSDEALAENLENWLGSFLGGKRSWQEAGEVDLVTALTAWIGPHRARELERLAPTHIEVPSGSRIRLDYALGGDEPVLAVRIQEVFGMTATPRIAAGRCGVLMHLLSPAQRPVQITSDLASFWKSGYDIVRKDLRGRYPRHYWPEDPLQAEPTRRIRRK